MRKSINFFLISVVLSTGVFVFAGCTPSPYILSTSIVPNGGGTVSPSSGTFKGTVVLVASPAQYYQFSDWAGDASGNTNPLNISMNSNKQIVASFVKIPRNLQVQVAPSNGGTVDPGSGTYDAGTQLTLSATPTTGYRFDHWSGAITGNSIRTTALIDANLTVTAYFTKVYNLAITVPPEVGGKVTPGNGSYDAGTSVTLTAKATICPYSFDRWSGTDSDNINPTKVTMSADKSIAVYFKKLTAGQPVTDTKTIWGGGSTSIPIELDQFEWVQGEIWGPYFHGSVQDPSGAIVKDLGAIQDVNFTFNADVAGHYVIVLQNTNTITAAAYRLDYTVYR